MNGYQGMDSFALQLPFSVSLVWFLLAIIKKKKSHSDRLMAVILAILCVVALLGVSRFTQEQDYQRMVVADIVLSTSILALFSFVCMYISSLYYDKVNVAYAHIMLLPAILYLSSITLIVILLGTERCADLLYLSQNSILPPLGLDSVEKTYLLISKVFFLSLFLFLILVSYIYILLKLYEGKFKLRHILSFLSNNKTSFVSNILCNLYILLFLFFALHTVLISIFPEYSKTICVVFAVTDSIVVFFVGYVSTIPPLPGGYMNMDRLMHPFDSMETSRQEFMDTIDSGPMADQPRSGYDKIMESFKELMIDKQGFLNPTLSIDVIAAQLSTNRTYVSRLVNIYYGMPFRDYLNKLRLDFAKQLMMDEPDAPIEYISLKSGFQSSTQFIRKFKESNGQTPSVWRSASL